MSSLDDFFLINLTPKTAETKKIQHDNDMRFSSIFGDINMTKPCSLIKAEKLETQNGIRYNLNVCQPLFSLVLLAEILNSRPVPITALIPIELIQVFGEGSK